MKKKVCILAYLLISYTFGGGLAQMSIANPGVVSSNTQSADIPAPAADLSNLVLTLQDLPPGFTEMSSDDVANFRNQLSQSPEFKPASLSSLPKNRSQSVPTSIPNRIYSATVSFDPTSYVRSSNRFRECCKSILSRFQP